MSCVTLLPLLLMISRGLANAEQNSVREKRSDDVSALQLLVEQQSQHIAKMDTELTALKAQLQVALKNVAFYAQHKPGTFSVGATADIVYDHTITNIGNAYDDHTGMFTAPVSGTYAFLVTCTGASSESVVGSMLVVQDVNTAYCLSYPRGETDEPETAHATVHLTAGERVWTRSGSSHPRNYVGGYYSTFAGFLVQADL